MIQYRGDSYPDWDSRDPQAIAREEGEKQLEDVVNHPSHYKQGKFETIEIIEDCKLNYNLGNAFKYISRAGKKDPNKHVQDLEKAIWYIKREIGNLERNIDDERTEHIKQQDWSL